MLVYDIATFILVAYRAILRNIFCYSGAYVSASVVIVDLNNERIS